MTQSSPTIGPNKTGLTYRQEDNSGKTALLSNSKGSTAPSYAVAGTLWVDDNSSPWLLKFFDGADWIVIGAVSSSDNTYSPYLGTGPVKFLSYAADTGGAANTYKVAPSPSIGTYVSGQTVLLVPGNSNTGASTLEVNGLPAKNIKTQSGGALPKGVLKSGAAHLLMYNGTDFLLMNPYSASSVLPYAADTGSANAYAVAPDPAITAYAAGLTVLLKPANANTGACTIAVNGLTAQSIKMPDGTAVPSGTLLTTGVYCLTYNGTNFVLVGVASQQAPKINQQVITSSGSFTTPANINTNTVFKIILVGAGGGGGGANNGVNTNAAGGGAGAIAIYYVSGLSPSTNYTVTIGAAGTAGTGSGSTGSVGGTGGSTSITIGATTVTASGGVGGAGATAASTAYQGGDGGTSTNGTVNIPGAPGDNSVAASGTPIGSSGSGASGPYGSGGRGAVVTTTAGEAASGYGAGGAGGKGGSGARSGGAGSPGVIFVEWVA